VAGSHSPRLAEASERQAAIAERVGDPAMRSTAAYNATCVALLHGDLATAEHGAMRALQIGTAGGQPDAEMIFGAQIMHVRLLQGRAAEIVDQLEQSVAANPRIPAFKGLLTCSLCWLDRRDEAARLVAQAAEDRFEHVPHDSVRTTALTLYADAAAQAGEPRAAEILYELIEPWADLIVWNGAVTEGHARTYLGLLAAALGRDEPADQHFGRAIEIQERGGLLAWAARAHLGWAEALVSRGDAERARHHAKRTLELAREHGYGAFEARAAAIELRT
jgi:tetratricopeptide (TPR) repeat protein